MARACSHTIGCAGRLLLRGLRVSYARQVARGGRGDGDAASTSIPLRRSREEESLWLCRGVPAFAGTTVEAGCCPPIRPLGPRFRGDDGVGENHPSRPRAARYTPAPHPELATRRSRPRRGRLRRRRPAWRCRCAARPGAPPGGEGWSAARSGRGRCSARRACGAARATGAQRDRPGSHRRGRVSEGRRNRAHPGRSGSRCGAYGAAEGAPRPLRRSHREDGWAPS